MPDQQAGGVVEAGVGEIEVVAHTDGTGVGVVAAHDRVVIRARDGLRESKRSLRCNSQSSGDDRRIPDKSAACDHSETSLSARSYRSEAIFDSGRDTSQFIVIRLAENNASSHSGPAIPYATDRLNSLHGLR